MHQLLGSRPVALAAFAAGEIGLDVATAVCGAIEALPAGVPAALTAEIEELLVSTGRDEGTRAVVIRAAEITHRFAPEVLEEAEELARDRRWLTLTQRHDGTVGVRGVLDKESGALALAVLEPLAAPEPATEGIPDFRSAGRRYADGFYRLCQIATPNLPDVRGERPNVLLMVGLDTLQQQRPSSPGRLAGGQVLSGAAARRVTCDANLVPVLLDTLGQPLDIGRASRSIPISIRRRWSCVTVAARSPGVTGHLPGAMRIAAFTGPTAGRRRCAISACSAHIITRRCITTAGISRWQAACRGSSHLHGSIRREHRGKTADTR